MKIKVTVSTLANLNNFEARHALEATIDVDGDNPRLQFTLERAEDIWFGERAEYQGLYYVEIWAEFNEIDGTQYMLRWGQ